ncbi:TonB-dependent receptor [Arcobacter sp. CECT 8986]|uniref:TonB-dependent receptor n=1 Tax=Arcobacter sp. CECT 8986 TaxID=2044507 RepID=UPI002159CF72|nr:TonB-dependent siderophore receptor [Arcobacter sp. CECT 8986]
MKKIITSSLVVMLSLAASQTLLSASSIEKKDKEEKSKFSAVLPTVYVEAMEEDDLTKGYVNYENASITRNNMSIKEIPQTIDTLNIQKNKNYGTNDLSSILEGNAGIDTTYDMRSDNIFIRGFRADSNDIYRDGIRESGQVRRSTANIERVEILKGPASLLYGRSNGGGVINMVSKYANFDNSSNIGLLLGSWKNRGLNLDVNRAVNDNVAVRFVSDITKGETFRKGIDKDIENETKMFSPSITVTDNDKIKWTAQYTYDYANRTPDRGPDKEQYDLMGISYDKAFAHDGDYVKDKLQILRSNLDIQLNDKWNFNWAVAYRKAEQNFDHYFLGTYIPATRLLNQSYAWQETENKTFSNTFTLNGEFNTGSILHNLTFGVDFSKEKREPKLYSTRDQLFDPFNSSSWTRIAKADATIKNDHKGISKGVFIEDVISLTPDFKVVLGGRFDKYTFSSTDISNNHSTYDGDSFSPRVGIVYDINDNHTVYASYNKSFSPYGGNSYLGVSASANADTFNDEPEYNEQYEVGIKSDWLDGNLSSTLSLYQIEHYNIRYRPSWETDLTKWYQRGKERSRGAELSIIGKMYEDFYLRTSVGVMDAKVIEDNSNPDNEGHHLGNTAQLNGNIFVRYAPQSEHFYGEVGLTHVGKRYFYSRSGEESTLDSFNRVDSMLGWKYKDVNITLGILNLFDKDYWRSSTMPGASRSATLRLNYKF